jgi:hypothetical protein
MLDDDGGRVTPPTGLHIADNRINPFTPTLGVSKHVPIEESNGSSGNDATVSPPLAQLAVFRYKRNIYYHH